MLMQERQKLSGKLWSRWGFVCSKKGFCSWIVSTAGNDSSGELMTLASPVFSLKRGCTGLVSDFQIVRPRPADALLLQ